MACLTEIAQKSLQKRRNDLRLFRNILQKYSNTTLSSLISVDMEVIHALRKNKIPDKISVFNGKSIPSKTVLIERIVDSISEYERRIRE